MAGATADAGHQPVRLDRALLTDLREALVRWPAWLFLGAFALGAGLQLTRGGADRLPLLLILAGGSLLYGVVAWFAGRNPRAHPEPDPVRAPRAEMAAVLVGYVGLAGYLLGFGLLPLAFVGSAAWLLTVAWAGYSSRDFGWITRGWRPLLPLLLAVTLPRLLFVGPAMLVGLPYGIVSGIVQQVLLQVGLTARIEALSRRPDVAAVLASLAFALAHAGMNLYQAEGDRLLAFGATLVFQAPIGLVFCIAYLRHRAPIALGVAHGIIIS